MSWYNKNNGNYIYADENGRFIAEVCNFHPEYLASIRYPALVELGSWITPQLAIKAIENYLEEQYLRGRDSVLFRKFGPLS